MQVERERILQNVAESTSREKRAGGFSFEQV